MTNISFSNAIDKILLWTGCKLEIEKPLFTILIYDLGLILLIFILTCFSLYIKTNYVFSFKELWETLKGCCGYVHNVVPEEEELNLYKPEKEVKSEHFIIEEERKSEDFIIEEGELKQSSEEEYELLPGEEDQLQYIPGEVPGKKTFQAETKTYGVVSGYKNKYSQQVEIDHRQRHIDKVTKRRERELNRITGYVDKGKNQTSTINGEKARNDSSIFGTWDFIAQDLIENNKPKKWERKN